MARLSLWKFNEASSGMSSDGKHFLAWVPNTGTAATTFTADLQSMSGSAAFAWWNPTTGSETTIATYPNTGTQSFTTPGDNGTGCNDWMLVGRVP